MPTDSGSGEPEILDAIERLRHVGANESLSEREGEAVATLYRRFAHRARRVARAKSVRRADADDAVHDVFLKLPSLLRRYEHRDFEAWLMQVVIRAVRARERACWREKELQPETVDDVADPAHLNDLPDDSEHLDLAAALSVLTEPYRRVVELRVFSECSHEEIARALSISVTASEVRLCRAMRRLRLARQTIVGDARTR